MVGINVCINFSFYTTLDNINDINLTDLEHPDIVTIALKKIGGNWTWTRSGRLDNKLVGWLSTPTTDNDCAGISGYANLSTLAAVTFPCTEVKRVVCE